MFTPSYCSPFLYNFNLTSMLFIWSLAHFSNAEWIFSYFQIAWYAKYCILQYFSIYLSQSGRLLFLELLILLVVGCKFHNSSCATKDHGTKWSMCYVYKQTIFWFFHKKVINYEIYIKTINYPTCIWQFIFLLQSRYNYGTIITL